MHPAMCALQVDKMLADTKFHYLGGESTSTIITNPSSLTTQPSAYYQAFPATPLLALGDLTSHTPTSEGSFRAAGPDNVIFI